MNKILLLLTFIACSFFVQAQSVSFYFPNPGSMPQNNGLWQDTGITINVSVNAPAQVTMATASAAGRQISLTTNGSGTYNGRLSLQGIAGDTLTLVIAAKDANNNTGDTSIRFIYRPLNDPSITLTTDSLADSSVARPLYPVHARCTAAGGSCTITAYDAGVNYTVVLGSGVDSLPVIDLTSYNGRKVKIKLVAVDSLGRTTQKTVTAFAESSPYLAKYLQVSGFILDYNYHKTLYIDRVTGYPMLLDAVTGQRDTLLATALNTGMQQKGFVTQQGAIWMQNGSINEWKNGQTVFTTAAYAFDVSAGYLAWTGNNQLGLRNLAAGDTAITDISPDTIGYFYRHLDVADNGTVALDVETFRNFYNIFKYQNGQFYRLTNGDLFLDPLTDGKNVIYNENHDLYLHNGQSNALLGAVGSNEAPAGSGWDYQVNSLYSAFIRQGQVNLRDTAGVIRQVGQFTYDPANVNGRPRLDLLNKQGNMMVTVVDSGRFYLDKSGMRHLVTRMPDVTDAYGEKLSRSFYDDGQWYVLIGNTIFKVAADSFPAGHVSSFEKQVKPDSSLAFAPEDFTARYTGPGAPVYIQFPGMPLHGRLMFGNQQVNIYYTIPKDSISKLAYIPDSAYTGADTLRWVAYNGVALSADTAGVFIQVTDSIITVTVPQPAISGLAAAYCGTARAQRVKIINMPAPASGISTDVLLDSSIHLPVTDSSFTIVPDTLSAGEHTITIVFAHDTTRKQLTRTFDITAPATPDVNVTVNVNPIVSDTIPVVITAVNAAGGGKLPLYTFAWDAAFNNQVQLESSNDKATIQPAEFKLGDNQVYVRMRSSDNCVTTATATDSIRINKTNITAVVDINAPGHMIHIYPNPFRGQLTLKGFQPAGVYVITLYDVQGRLLLQQRIVNNTQVQLQVPESGGNIYLLNIYDEQHRKMLGTEKLLGY